MINIIKKCLEQKLDAGFKDFIIYPYGDVGMRVKQILNEVYGIQEMYIIDEYLCKYNKKITSPDILKNLDCYNTAIIIATVKPEICKEIESVCSKYFAEIQIGKLIQEEPEKKNIQYTKKGKYSCGPLCNHILVESCGAFCSFALGTDVVRNHPNQYVSTHPFLYYHGVNDDLDRRDGRSSYSDYKDMEWFFEGVTPRGGGT